MWVMGKENYNIKYFVEKKGIQIYQNKKKRKLNNFEVNHSL
jgi:hypothetical protein